MEIGNKAAGNNDHKAVDRNVSARSRFSSENTTTTMTGLSEYELPLDPAWEFPRDDLMIGPGGVHQSNFRAFYLGNLKHTQNENLELPPTVFTSGDTKVGVCSKHEFAHERFQSFSGYRSIGALVIEVVKVD